MKTIIYRDIDLFEESVELLKNLAENEQPLETKKRLLTKYQIDPKTVEEPFAVWEELAAGGRRRLKDQMDRIREYFQPYKKEGTLTKAQAAMLADDWQYGIGIEERRQESLSLTEEERSRRFYRLLQSGYGLDVDVSEQEVEQCRELRDILGCLEQSDYAPEQKWQLLGVFYNPGQAWEELFPLLQAAEAVIREKEPLWRPLVETFYRNCQNRLKTQTLQEYIKNQTGVTLEENPLGTVVIPLLLGAVKTTIAVKIPEEGWGTRYQDICRVGMIAERLDRETLTVEADARRRQIASMMKLLSDESKLEILSLLKESRYYGGELARKLGLTTATISYHMTNLMSNNLVNVNKEGNRVYYELNEPVLRRVLQDAEELLLHRL